MAPAAHETAYTDKRQRDMAFVHLHVHTHYSILDGQSSIENLFNRADELGMPGLAITDHGNMYGVKEFFKFAAKHPSVKPIIGCEIYVSKFDHKLKDKAHGGYYHLILLAKNYNGYKNLMKIVSTGHLEGMYYRPRVSHEVLEQYHEDLICSSACMAGEIPRLILEGDIEGAEKAIEWHKGVFGDDYYLEVMLHKTEVPGQSLEVYEKEKEYDEVIFDLAKKHGVKVIATNDAHFVRKEDGPAHDRLICLTTNEFVDSPNRLRYTQQEYIKSEEEMAALFPDHPEVISNTIEVCDKVERYTIDRGHVLPKFQIDETFLGNIEAEREKYKAVIDAGRFDEKNNDRGEEFCNSVAFLCHLTYKGARERYGDTLNAETAERLDFELKTISRMGFPDYFLIVQDYIANARAHGISVGPGRGSAAGSAVAYCLGITNLDPIKYDLLFERFLNPERVSMPDIDVDFDDDGRYKVIQYVQERYGMDHVSHVITFGTMAAKGAIKDVARISRLPLDESNRLTKMIPDKPITVTEEVQEELKLDEEPEAGDKIVEKDGKRYKVVKKDVDKKPTLKNCIKYVPELKAEYEGGSELVREVLKYALQLEGCIRQVGIHACAMIIGRGNLTDYIPITLGEDKATGQKVWVSQYEGSFIEDVGMLKMDFLGLKTLSIIKICLAEIKKRFGRDIDIEKIDITDPKAYEIYCKGDTKSVFQFESPGMMEWLQKLHPERFEDLIAMNALYRPGPMDYIPSFVARKQGTEPITYDLPVMEEFLKETYGVTVYQEQVMLISQKVAGFSKGKADKLRKAMGKKKIDILQSLYSDFISGGIANGHPEEVLKKIWKDWEKFASYAFNKSHATCYAWVSYQTGWLKAHYPSEFQAANLSMNKNNMTEIQAIMADCKKHGIKVLNPDVNESESNFTVNKNGDIRFGMGGMKGFGANIVDAIIAERQAHGLFSDIYDFCERMSGIINRKAMEALIYAGAFDAFGIERHKYFLVGNVGADFLEDLLNYAAITKKNAEDNDASLFGDAEELKVEKPQPPKIDREPDELELLRKEKEMVGMYLSAHPLKRYEFEMETFTNCKLTGIPDAITECERERKMRKIAVAGFVTSTEIKTSKTGRPYSKVVLEDFSGTYELALFGKDYDNFMPKIQDHTAIFVEGEIRPAYMPKPDEKGAPVNVPYKFRVERISHLGNVCEERIAGLMSNVDTSLINPEFRKRLVSWLKSSKGPVPFFVNIVDMNKKYKVECTSRKFRVTVNSEFISGLKDMGLPCKVLCKGGQLA